MLDIETLIHAVDLIRQHATSNEQAIKAVKALLAEEGIESSEALEALLEACVGNKSGKGHHDDKTGAPCSMGGAATTGSQARKKAKAFPSALPTKPEVQRSIKDIVKAGYGAGKQLVGALTAKVPAPMKVPLGNVWHGVHGVLMAVNHGTQALARQVAAGKGLDEAAVEKLAGTLGAVDLAFQGAMFATAVAAMPVAHGLAIAAKVASYCPIASAAYVLKSSASPAGALATLKAASTLLKEKFPDKVRGAASFLWGAIRHPITPHSAHAHEWLVEAIEEYAQQIADAMAASADQDKWLVLFSVAFDETRDVKTSIEMANRTVASLQESCVPNQSGKGKHDDKTGFPCSTGSDKPAAAPPGGRPSGTPANATASAVQAMHPKAKAHLTEVATALKAAPGLSPQQKSTYFKSYMGVVGKMNEHALGRFLAGSGGPPSFLPDLPAVRNELVESAKARGNAKDVATIQNVKGVIGGAYNTNQAGKRYLVLDGERPSAGANAATTTAAVYAHEMVHSIDGPQKELSKSQDWQDAWQAELSGGKLTKYAGTSPSEGFAEFGRLLLAGEHNIEKVKKAMPRCYAFWQSRGIVESLLLARDVADATADLLEEDQQLLPEVFSEGIDLSDGSHCDVLAGEDTAEGCIPNKAGKGHHDTVTGAPCKAGNAPGGPGKPTGKQAGPAADSKAQRKTDAKGKAARQKAKQKRERRAAEGDQQLVDAPVQRVGNVTARGLADALATAPGVEHSAFIPGSKPPDVTLQIGGRLHGIESKAFVTTKKRPLSVKMGRLTRLQKEDWEAEHKATMHTVMVDHTHQWGQHGEATADKITASDNFPCFYRRGGSNGAATDPPAIRISSPADLVAVMQLSDDELQAKYGGRGGRPIRLKGSDQEAGIRKRGSKR